MINTKDYVLNLYENVIRKEFPNDTDFGISFLADSEEYADTIVPLNAEVGVKIDGCISGDPGFTRPDIKIMSHFDYNEGLLDSQILSEVNVCTLKGLKFLKIITPLFIGDSHDIILAPNSYFLDILHIAKTLKDNKINTSIHAPLIDLPLEMLQRDIIDFLTNEKFATFCKKYSIKLKRGFIFEGPPGNGKTLSLAWLKSQAQQNKIEFRAYKSARDYMENDRDATDNQNKRIIVFEEFDTYLQEREVKGGSDTRIESNNVMGSLFQLLDGIEDVTNAVFIFTTNFINTMDSALTRPGRIDKIIKFNAPTRKSQAKFFLTYLSEYTNTTDLLIRYINSTSVPPSYASMKAIVDNVRISEFWNMQERKADVRISETAILAIAENVLKSSNKNNTAKMDVESIL
jgi:DNA polymerase III delta prime subunit